MKSPFRVTTLHRSGFTVIELLVVLGILSLLMALLLPVIQKARESARRIDCVNRLRQLALAAQNFHDLHGHLPSGTQVTLSGTDATPYRSWITRLLPQLDQLSLFVSIEAEFQAFPDSHSVFRSEQHPQFHKPFTLVTCPSDLRAAQARYCETYGYEVGLTSYLGCNGTNHQKTDGMLFGDSHAKFSDVGDGLSNTLLIGERPASPDFVIGWWYAGVGRDGNGAVDHHLGSAELNRWANGCGSEPFSLSFGYEKYGRCGQFQFWSFHDGAVNFALCDGSVKGIGPIDAHVFTALGSRRGGEVPGDW